MAVSNLFLLLVILMLCRCLAENKGDVAFVKHSTVLDNVDGKNTESWAKNLKSADFKLLCLNGGQDDVENFENCHLARAPNHAVISRQEKASLVRQVLLDQQNHFGTYGSEKETFNILPKTRNLLFQDNTECLTKIPDGTTYESFLGKDYVTAVGSLKKCLTSSILPVCEFHKF